MAKEARYSVLTPSAEENFDNQDHLTIHLTRHKTPRKKCLIVTLIGIFLLIAIIIVIVVATKKKDEDKSSSENRNVASKYVKAAVAADAKVCSQVGADMLKKNGTAVDAAVATLFCVGVVNLQSCGIGGGGFMVFYQRASRMFTIFDYREVAPLAATEDMYVGGLSIGVPGQVKGLHTAHKKFGLLSWSELIEPAIKLANEGFIVSAALESTINYASKSKDLTDNLKKLLTKDDDVTFLKEGDVLVNKRLGETLRIIQQGANDFYEGPLAKKIITDITQANGIISEKDLKDYTVKERKVLTLKLPNDLTLNTMTAPGGGPVVAMINNIMSGYDFSKIDLSRENDQVDFYHKLVEAMKFSYAQRGFLGDPDFVPEQNISDILKLATNLTFGEMIRQNKIWMNQTHPISYYGGTYGKTDSGTSHVSVLAENGDAVAATDTINYGFGSFVRSLETGIIYNNEMDDFSTPGKSNLFGYPPSPANYVYPGKRPLSSMSPSMVTDKNGDVKMVAGASGGSRIISGTVQVLIKKLFLNLELGDAVASYRLHHQGLPNNITYNSKYAPPMRLIKDLEKLGHSIVEKGSISVVQAIFKDDDYIYAMSDPRKGGEADGV